MSMNECSCDIMHTYDGTLDVFTSEIIFSLNIHCCHEDNLNVEGQATPIIVFFYLYFSSHLIIDDSYTIDDKSKYYVNDLCPVHIPLKSA